MVARRSAKGEPRFVVATWDARRLEEILESCEPVYWPRPRKVVGWYVALVAMFSSVVAGLLGCFS